MGDVVEGPWGKESNILPFPSENDLLDKLVLQLTEALFDGFREAGFDNLGEIVYTKDLTLINEAIRSYLMKLQERYHCCQDVADALFNFDENGDMEFTPSIDIIFDDDEFKIEFALDEDTQLLLLLIYIKP